MKRLLPLSVLTLLVLSACTDQPTAPSVSPPTEASPFFGHLFDHRANPIEIAVIGDVPYGATAIGSFPALIGDINSDPKVRLAVHVGDIKAGSEMCTNERFQVVADAFDTFKDPLVYTPGDNEWTDCHRANNGGYHPLERLHKLRQLFFSQPGRTLGERRKLVQFQPWFPENTLWTDSRVTFAALHVLGSNNGLNPWFTQAGQTPETPQQTTQRTTEVALRQAANLAWLKYTFLNAKLRNSVGIVLFFQADLWNPFDRGTVPPASFTAHNSFVAKLSELAADFDGPILLISGDSHDYRVDVGVPWFSLYGVPPRANVTQIIVDNSIEDDTNWLRLKIDPKSPGVFSWSQVFVP